MPTIFDDLVTIENDFTNLLRGILERQPSLLVPGLYRLAGIELKQRDLITAALRTQTVFAGANGRAIPDLLIETESFRCLIEIKIDPGLPLSEAQKQGYESCFSGPKRRYLGFLVPDNWQYKHQFEQIRSSDCSQLNTILSTWPELVKAIEPEVKKIGDPVLNEALLFLSETFEAHKMTPKEESSLAQWPNDTVSALRKLELTLQQAKKIFASRGLGTEFEKPSFDEHGFYLKQDGVYLLWIGIWSKAPAPLSFGYNTSHPRWRKLSPTAPPDRVNDGYLLWKLLPETWDDASLLVQQVSRFLEEASEPGGPVIP
jgi:hypothetical protein